MLPHLPDEPGVYLMRDAAGMVIYVGKARSLRKRLSSYFSASGKPDIKTAVLVKKIANIETIVTASEKEALILESNLIKRHRPRYNVILKDDKRYPSLRLDVPHPSAAGRSFVLAPLSELAPELVPPGWAMSVDGARDRAAATEAPDAVTAVGAWDFRTGRWQEVA